MFVMMSSELLLLLLFCSIFIDDDVKLRRCKLAAGKEDLIDVVDDDFDDDENKDELRREAFITTAFIPAALVHTYKEAILYRIINYMCIH
jgi:hypothetical protein|tara:strand:+ start:1496 stop:1765 length:270 start_codon:yes stop_codon:yes gene_type:complete